MAKKSKAEYIREHGGSEATFNLVDEATVKRLVRDGKVKVPSKKISIPKDERWNEKYIGSQILQGIEKGEPIAAISNRIFPEIYEKAGRPTDRGLIQRCIDSSVRNARTMTTSAENHGRLDSYKDLADQGVIQRKVWIATPDDRTRESHLFMDGEEVDIDEEFSNRLMFPGDEDGDPEEVWNCRCTMSDHIVGFMGADGEIHYVDYERDETLHDRQIEKEKDKRDEERKVVNGKDIFDTWKRRPDEFDYDIEDVINAQGFDGLPKIVDADEFDKYVEQANDGNGFVAQRAYSAESKDILDAYQNELYNGAWYVDCSTNGAAYGQGMYSTGDLSGIVTDEMKKASEFYGELNKNNVYRIDTFTLDKSAKFIDYDKLYNDFRAYGMKTQENNAAIRTKGIKDAHEELAKKLLNSAGFKNNSYAEDFFYGNLSLKDVNWERMGEAYKNLGVESKKINDLINEYYKLETKYTDEYLSKIARYEIKDIGAYAALKGYDVIIVNKGIYGTTESIILNRTKMIIKGLK